MVKETLVSQLLCQLGKCMFKSLTKIANLLNTVISTGDRSDKLNLLPQVKFHGYKIK